MKSITLGGALAIALGVILGSMGARMAGLQNLLPYRG